MDNPLPPSPNPQPPLQTPPPQINKYNKLPPIVIVLLFLGKDLIFKNQNYLLANLVFLVISILTLGYGCFILYKTKDSWYGGNWDFSKHILDYSILYGLLYIFIGLIIGVMMVLTLF